MSKMFFVETLKRDGTPSGQVEEVDEFVFNARHQAIQPNDRPRYSEAYMVVDGIQMEIHFAGNTHLLSNLSRLAGVQNHNGITNFCQRPETVLIRKRKGGTPFLYDTTTKAMYKFVRLAPAS